MKAVILAAGMGLRLGNITKTLPKAFIPIEGKPLIEYSLNSLKRAGIKELIMVVGFMENFFKEKLGTAYKGMKIKYFVNKDYATTGSMCSLSKTEDLINDNILLLDSDILYEERALVELINCPFEDVILITNPSGSGDEIFICIDNEGNLKDLGKNISNKHKSIGETVGITKLSPNFLKHLYAAAKEDYANNKFKHHYEECIFKTSKKHPVKCLLIEDLVWTEIDTKNHLKKAREEIFHRINDRLNQP